MGLLGLVLFYMVWGIAEGKTDDCECEDEVPEIFSCEQQKEWGKCDAAWMVQLNYCAKTCQRCLCSQNGQIDAAISAPSTTGADAIAKLNELMDQQQQISQPQAETNNNDKLDQQTQINFNQPNTEAFEIATGAHLDSYQNYLLDKLRQYTEEQIQQQQQQQQQQQYEAPSIELPRLNLTISSKEEDDDEEVEKEVNNLQVAMDVLNISSAGENIFSASEIKTAAEGISSPFVDVPASAPIPLSPIVPQPSPVAVIPSPKIVREEKQLISTVAANVSAQVVRDVKVPVDANPLLASPQECTPMSSILQGTPGLQQFHRLLRLVDYSIDNLDQKITLFAPIDSGISKFLRDYNLTINDLDDLPPEDLKTLQTKFQPFVKYHFVDQTIGSNAVEKFKQIRLETHFEGNLLYLRDLTRSSRYPFQLIDGQGDKCSAMIVDLEACEGVVHMIACMLRPDI